ncbi:unnamed protein product [Albugo candida]|uniref:Uncharacterized protein n=1 Tax=Albugo candida TaxID=65357 RepID=A0A024G666_9STRA|nr:unnamed protein product [Albugo candida]|eukprot:CCI41805.1 unnamed protein product [Albugo candida]
MSRAVIDGAERKARLCDKCVKNSVPGLLTLLRSPILTNKRKAVIALKSLMENESNHEYLTRLGGLPHLFAAMHCGDETIATDAAGAICALSTSVPSTLQMVLEGAVLQLLEVSENSSTWPCCLRALRNIWKQVNRPSFRRMLYAVARITSYTSVELRSNVLLTFVHMMDTDEVSTLLEEGLLVVLYLMLQSEHIFPRCAAAHAIKHLIPSSYNPKLTIEIPPYVVDDHEELFANVSLSDLQFLVKGHIAPINAHKVVLFFRNAYFKEMVAEFCTD